MYFFYINNTTKGNTSLMFNKLVQYGQYDSSKSMGNYKSSLLIIIIKHNLVCVKTLYNLKSITLSLLRTIEWQYKYANNISRLFKTHQK